MAETKPIGYITDRNSNEYLEVNSCGIEFINVYDRGSCRPNGRSDYHILYVKRGICRLMLDHMEFEIGEGGIVLFRPNEPQIYRYLKEDNSISHYIHFSGTGCECLLEQLGLSDMKIFMMGRSLTYEDLSEKLVREFTMGKPLHEHLCAAYVYHLLCIIARKYALRQNSVTHKNENRINAACRRIYENIQSPPTPDQLAAECCLSVSRFTHLFHEITGKSVSEFITAIRMDRAKELIVGTDMSIREISSLVGYDNQNYFSRRFHKQTGMSPSEYRQSERTEALPNIQ